MNRLSDWIEIDNLYWPTLSKNPNAIDLLEQNKHKIDWYNISCNPKAIHLLEQNINKINWLYLSFNSHAIHLLEQYINKIDWIAISQNSNIFTYDYEKMKEYNKTSGFSEELCMIVFHPVRLLNICKKYNIEFDELIEIY